MRKLFLFLFAALMSVGMWADPIIWYSLPSDGGSYTQDDVTLTCADVEFDDGDLYGGGTFTTNLGNFTKIEVTASSCNIGGDGWSGDDEEQTWTGNAASVSFSGDIGGLSSIVFTIGGGSAPAVPSWVRDGDEWDNASKTLTVNSNLIANAYKENTEIEHVIISNTVASIGNAAFLWCDGLTSVTIGDHVTSIGESAFNGCSGLTSITIPNSVTSIGESAFNGCSGLTGELVIPNSVISIGDEAFNECSHLTSITIPNSVTSIGYGVFYGCSGLTSITIPNSVTSIGATAFMNCSSLSSIEIPSGVTSIGWGAFRKCTGLTSITIPSSVTSIGANAFYECTNITDVYCYPNAANLTWNESGCNDFKTDGSTVCHVHADQLDAYKSKFTGVVNVTFAGDLDAPTPTGFDITANLDPQNAGVYYSTFYHGSVDYALPANVKAYKAVISGSDLLLSEVAAEGDVLPKGNAVILRSSVQNYTLTPSDATPVNVGDDNDLEGSDDAIATPAKCYVLSCENNLVGFYQYGADNLNPHKAYVIFSGSGSNPAPRRMPFIFDAATGVENVQGNVQSTKVLRDGQLIIIRNGVEYNANGMMVK